MSSNSSIGSPDIKMQNKRLLSLHTLTYYKPQPKLCCCHTFCEKVRKRCYCHVALIVIYLVEQPLLQYLFNTLVYLVVLPNCSLF